MLLSKSDSNNEKNDFFLKSKNTLVFKKNETIYNRGERLENIYIILTGLVNSIIERNKNSRGDMTLNKGSTLGLMDLVLNRNYSKIMIAKKPSILAVINKSLILDTYNTKDFRSVLLKSLALDIDTKHPNMWS